MLLIAAGVFLGGIAIYALYSGRLFCGRIFVREREPFLFWINVVGVAFLGAFALYAGTVILNAS